MVRGGTVAISSCTISGNTASGVRANLQKFPSPPSETHTCLLVAGRLCLRRFRHGLDDVFLDLREYSFQCACSCSKLPIAPMEDSRCSLFAGRRCLYQEWHSVNCELPDLFQHSFPSTCQPRLQTSHRPDGKVADVLAPTHACTTANTSVNYSGCVLQRP
jgi:hypothetical protein